MCLFLTNSLLVYRFEPKYGESPLLKTAEELCRIFATKCSTVSKIQLISFYCCTCISINRINISVSFTLLPCEKMKLDSLQYYYVRDF
jgi:hypothetical protein